MELALGFPAGHPYGSELRTYFGRKLTEVAGQLSGDHPQEARRCSELAARLGAAGAPPGPALSPVTTSVIAAAGLDPGAFDPRGDRAVRDLVCATWATALLDAHGRDTIAGLLAAGGAQGCRDLPGSSALFDQIVTGVGQHLAAQAREATT